MFKLFQSQNSITVKSDTLFLKIGIATIFMAIVGVRILFGALPLEDDYTSFDVFGLVFICVWLIIVLWMGVFAFLTYSKQIVIDAKGVLFKTWFTKKHIKWVDIKDWGLSYCGQTRGEGNTYYLYFSEHECPIKNECKKKLKGKMIKTFVIGGDYSETISVIIPFCKEKTDIMPFVGKDVFHII